jgi:hypothetical protein
MASRIANMTSVGTFCQRLQKLFARITFGTTGAPTLDQTRDVNVRSDGILSITQLGTSNSSYVLHFTDAWKRLLSLLPTWGTQGPTAPQVCVPCRSSMGGVAAITTATAVAGNYVKINKKTYTAVAYNGSPTGQQWRVGNSNDATSAINLAAIINATADSGVTATILTDVVPVICLKSNTPGITISKSGSPITVVGSMKPGLVLQFLVGATPTCPATGDELLLDLTMEN